MLRTEADAKFAGAGQRRRMRYAVLRGDEHEVAGGSGSGGGARSRNGSQAFRSAMGMR